MSNSNQQIVKDEIPPTKIFPLLDERLQAWIGPESAYQKSAKRIDELKRELKLEESICEFESKKLSALLKLTSSPDLEKEMSRKWYDEDLEGLPNNYLGNKIDDLIRNGADDEGIVRAIEEIEIADVKKIEGGCFADVMAFGAVVLDPPKNQYSWPVLYPSDEWKSTEGNPDNEIACGGDLLVDIRRVLDIPTPEQAEEKKKAAKREADAKKKAEKKQTTKSTKDTKKPEPKKPAAKKSPGAKIVTTNLRLAFNPNGTIQGFCTEDGKEKSFGISGDLLDAKRSMRKTFGNKPIAMPDVGSFKFIPPSGSFSWMCEMSDSEGTTHIMVFPTDCSGIDKAVAITAELLNITRALVKQRTIDASPEPRTPNPEPSPTPEHYATVFLDKDEWCMQAIKADLAEMFPSPIRIAAHSEEEAINTAANLLDILPAKVKVGEPLKEEPKPEAA